MINNNYSDIANTWVHTPYKDLTLLKILARTGSTLAKLSSAHIDETETSKQELEAITLECSKVITLMIFDLYQEIKRLNAKAAKRELNGVETKRLAKLNKLLDQ